MLELDIITCKLQPFTMHGLLIILPEILFIVYPYDNYIDLCFHLRLQHKYLYHMLALTGAHHTLDASAQMDDSASITCFVRKHKDFYSLGNCYSNFCFGLFQYIIS